MVGVNPEKLASPSPAAKTHAMPRTLMQNVVQQLERERIRLQTGLHRVSAALTAFGRTYLDGAKQGRTGVKRRTISSIGRRRIAAARRARWAKVRKKKKS